MRTMLGHQDDHFGQALADTYSASAKPVRVPRPPWVGPALLVLALPFVVAAACGDDEAPASSVQACADRMRADIAATGRANESAPECAGLTEDQIADAGISVLAGQEG